MKSLIPESWFNIDTGMTTFYPHKEGILGNKESKPVLRLVAVYHNLMEIPEAENQLIECNKQFINEFAPEILALFEPEIQKAKEGKVRWRY